MRIAHDGSSEHFLCRIEVPHLLPKELPKLAERERIMWRFLDSSYQQVLALLQ